MSTSRERDSTQSNNKNNTAHFQPPHEDDDGRQSLDFTVKPKKQQAQFEVENLDQRPDDIQNYLVLDGARTDGSSTQQEDEQNQQQTSSNEMKNSNQQDSSNQYSREGDDQKESPRRPFAANPQPLSQEEYLKQYQQQNIDDYSIDSQNAMKEEIWRQLEEKRFIHLKQAAVNLQSEMMLVKQRCPKCTLAPPCQHYKNHIEILQEGPSIVLKGEFKQHLSPKKREIIVKTLKEQYHKEIVAGNIKRNDGDQLEIIQEKKSLSPDRTQFMSQFNSTFQKDPRVTSRLQNVVTPITQEKRLSQMSNTAQTLPQINRNLFGVATADSNKHGLQVNPLNFSKLGANIMNNQSFGVFPGSDSMSQRKHKDYLKKHQGNGGSPVPGADSSRHKHNLSTISGSGRYKDTSQRDRTTVRIRGKGNSFAYVEGSFAHPLYSMKNETARKNAMSTLQQNHLGGSTENSMLDSPHNRSVQKQQSFEERERMQAMLFRYREDKIQRELEKIEMDRQLAEMQRYQKREDQVNLRRYNDQLKERLAQHQQVKYQELQEKMEMAKAEQQKVIEKERQKKLMQEEQRRYINQYREMKRRTDSLLSGSGVSTIEIGNQFEQNSMFYERHQNFGFPITTTTNGGAVITSITGNGLNSSLNAHPDALSKLKAEVKSGQVQLDDTEFKNSSGGKMMVTPGEFDHEFDELTKKQDSLDLVGGKRASQQTIKGSQQNL